MFGKKKKLKAELSTLKDKHQDIHTRMQSLTSQLTDHKGKIRLAEDAARELTMGRIPKIDKGDMSPEEVEDLQKDTLQFADYQRKRENELSEIVRGLQEELQEMEHQLSYLQRKEKEVQDRISELREPLR